MPTTPRMSFPYPSYRKDPWFDDAEDFNLAVDASMYTTREDRNLVLMEGGTVTWAAGTGTLTWSENILLNASITGLTWVVAAGSVVIESGECLYVQLVRHPASNTTVTIGVSSQVPSDDASILLCLRKGDTLYWRDGKVINDGFGDLLFTSTIGGSAAGATTTSYAIVDPNRSDAADDTDLTTAFLTIQKAVDEVAAGGIVMVAPKPTPYDETVFIRKNLRLMGMSTGEQNDETMGVAIRPTTSPGAGVFVTSATLASAQILNARVMGDYDANYATDLVLDGSVACSEVSISGIYLYGNTAAYPGLVAVGVGVDEELLASYLDVREVRVRNVYLRNNNHSVISQSTLSGLLTVRNISSLTINHSECYQTTYFQYNVAENMPTDGQEAVTARYCYFSGRWYFDYDFTASFHRCEFATGIDADTGNCTGGFTTKNCTIENPVTVEGDAGWLSIGDYVRAYVSLLSGGTNTACNAYGSEFLNAITDPASRFVYHRMGVGGDVIIVPLVVANNETVDGVTSTKALGAFSFDPTEHGNIALKSFEFEVVLSVNLGTLTATALLYNLTNNEVVTGTTLTAVGLTTPTKRNSGALTVGAAVGNLRSTETVYEVRLQNSGSLVTDLTYLGIALIRIVGLG